MPNSRRRRLLFSTTTISQAEPPIVERNFTSLRIPISSCSHAAISGAVQPNTAPDVHTKATPHCSCCTHEGGPKEAPTNNRASQPPLDGFVCRPGPPVVQELSNSRFPQREKGPVRSVRWVHNLLVLFHVEGSCVVFLLLVFLLCPMLLLGAGPRLAGWQSRDGSSDSGRK